MSENLVNLNKFTQGDNQVWFDASKGDVDFGYSDGQEIEHRLKAIFTQASDLSCTSYELKSYISDWPTEYHLTPVRSNLIRALNLTGVKRVLELGCGCGSISRYLGDVKHADGSVIQVDSVEGSPIRAELAALRCRDLDNVTVSTANFNQIEFPDNYYDLVLYVGVTEYAGRFSDGKSDVDALQDLLSLAKQATTSDGVVMVAIENRTGMKYVQGANEDHYAKPYVGIHNYTQPAGIRTYTKGEWKEQIELAGFSEQEFIYPFPDYKIPMIFLGEEYVDQNPYSFNHLEACRSRDYVKVFDFASKEALFWESAAASQTLGDYANSFMMLMGNNAENIAQMSQNDFLHLPSYDRNLEFCMSIAKPKGKDHIVREYIHDAPEKRELISDEVQHVRIDEEPFFKGAMLSVEWSRSLVSYPDLDVFEQYLRDYFVFLENKQNANQLTIDLLPSNIVVGENLSKKEMAESERYKVVDEEWQLSGDLEEAISAEFVYFRAVLFFYMTYPDFVEQKVVAHKNLHTLQDLVGYAFNVIGRPLDGDQLLKFADANEAFQNKISSRPVNINFQSVLNKMDSVFTLGWKSITETGNSDEKNQPFLIEDRISISGNGKFERETLQFDLPAKLRSVSDIEFLPCGESFSESAAFFRVYALRLLAVNNQQESREIFSLDNEQVLSDSVKLSGVTYENGSAGLGFYTLAGHPTLSWQLNDGGKIETLSANEFLRVEIDARYPLGEHAQKMLERNAEIFTLQHQLDELKRSRAFALANKLSLLATRLRGAQNRFRQIAARLFSMTGLKKKALNKQRRVSWVTSSSSQKRLNEKPLVSIVIPYRDSPDLLEKCMRSIAEKTTYSHYEIIAVSNDSVHMETQQVREELSQRYSQLRFIEKNIPFNFSRLVNQGVAESKGHYIVLLNNDIEILSEDWLEQLLTQATLDDIACVGGRLEFEDGHIQHLGLHIGSMQLPEHSFKTMHRSVHGLQPYLQQSRYVSAVTGALLMVSREIWNQLNGFDETDFGVAFNDVDFCLRAIELNYQNVVNPHVCALHHESVSRGYENTLEKMRRFESEKMTFIQRHQSYVEKQDPYFSA